MPSNEEWQDWLSELKKEALKEGISQNTIDEKEFKKVLKVENGLLELPKDKKSKAIFGSDTSEETFHIPDLILLDPENKEILMVEGEKAENSIVVNFQFQF